MGDDLTYVSDDANGTNDGQKVTWTVDVPAGGSKTINISCQVNESATGKVINNVKITPNDDIEVLPQGDEDDEVVSVSPNDDNQTADDDDNDEKSTTTRRVVSTGDDTALPFYALMMLFAIIALGTMTYRRRRG